MPPFLLLLSIRAQAVSRLDGAAAASALAGLLAAHRGLSPGGPWQLLQLYSEAAVGTAVEEAKAAAAAAAASSAASDARPSAAAAAAANGSRWRQPWWGALASYLLSALCTLPRPLLECQQLLAVLLPRTLGERRWNRGP